MMWTRPVEQVVSQATRAPGSCARMASRMASEIWSQILSGCPSVTEFGREKELWTLGKASYKIFGRNATVETKSAQPERLRAVTLIFRFPAGLGTLRIHAGCRASSGLFPQPLLISCYSVVVMLVYTGFWQSQRYFVVQFRRFAQKWGRCGSRVWFWRRALPHRGKVAEAPPEAG